MTSDAYTCGRAVRGYFLLDFGNSLKRSLINAGRVSSFSVRLHRG